MKLTVQRGELYEYRDETGRLYFSVSQVRKEMWDGLAKVPPAILEAARERGSRLHRRFAKAMFAQLELCPYPAVIPEYPGYCASMDEWIGRVKPIPKLIERSSVNPKLGIAGTADLLCLYGSAGWVTLVDLKSGEETPTDGVQLDAYETMEAYRDAKRKLDLYLDKDGGRAREEWRTKVPTDWACFLQALSVLKGRANIAKWRAGR